MKEPNAKTWFVTLVFYWLTSLAFSYLHKRVVTWHVAMDTFGSSLAFATVVWLIALARWHRAIIKG